MNVTILRKTYELPTLTMDVIEAIDAVQDAQGRRATFEAERAVLDLTIGVDAADEVTGGHGVDDCDLIALTNAFVRVSNAYMTPLVKEQAAGAREQVREIQPVLDAIKLASQARSGFQLVK